MNQRQQRRSNNPTKRPQTRSWRRVLTEADFSIEERLRGNESKYIVTHQGFPPFEIERSTDPADIGLWYVVVIDNEYGRVIDERVPEGYFKTLRELCETLVWHLRESAPDPAILKISKDIQIPARTFAVSFEFGPKVKP